MEHCKYILVFRIMCAHTLSFDPICRTADVQFVEEEEKVMEHIRFIKPEGQIPHSCTVSSHPFMLFVFCFHARLYKLLLSLFPFHLFSLSLRFTFFEHHCCCLILITTETNPIVCLNCAINSTSDLKLFNLTHRATCIF